MIGLLGGFFRTMLMRTANDKMSSLQSLPFEQSSVLKFEYVYRRHPNFDVRSKYPVSVFRERGSNFFQPIMALRSSNGNLSFCINHNASFQARVAVNFFGYQMSSTKTDWLHYTKKELLRTHFSFNRLESEGAQGVFYFSLFALTFFHCQF